jgi:hypothetical protein
MSFHIASMIALFVDQVAQTPVVAQCAQTLPEPQWKWWLKLLAEILGPLLSTAGSIYVAWKVFHWQGKKDRKQWVRDQKIEEWKRVIPLVAEYEQLMPLGEPGSSTVDAVRYKVLPLCDRIAHVLSGALFIAPMLSAHQIRSGLTDIIRQTNAAIGRIENFPQSSPTDKIMLGTPLDNARKIRNRLQELHTKLVSVAQADLFLNDEL